VGLPGRAAWLTVVTLCAACSLVDSARDTSTSSVDDAGPTPPDAIDAVDAAVDAGCEPGARVAGLAVFNASPIDAASACDLDNALARDGNVTGLDAFDPTDDLCGQMGAETAAGGCGCVGIDLGGAEDLAAIIVRAAPVEDACGGGCVGADCGTGHSFTAWYGLEPGPYTLAAETSLTSDQLTDYTIDIGEPVRYVVVCRDWWAETRDDVAVDSIEGVVCRP
jgi:hypothetical protein